MATYLANNLSQLESILDKYIIKAMDMTGEIILQIIAKHVNIYYEDTVYDRFHNVQRSELVGGVFPIEYKRTYTMKEALSMSTTRKVGQDYVMRVGFDDWYMTFRYKGWEKRWACADNGQNRATGEYVLEMANEGNHGNDWIWSVNGNHLWDDAIIEINKTYGSVDNLFYRNLKRVMKNI